MQERRKFDEYCWLPCGPVSGGLGSGTTQVDPIKSSSKDARFARDGLCPFHTVPFRTRSGRCPVIRSIGRPTLMHEMLGFAIVSVIQGITRLFRRMRN